MRHTKVKSKRARNTYKAQRKWSKIMNKDETAEKLTIPDLTREPDTTEIVNFSCQKNVIQQMIDPRYVIKYKMDDYINNDRTLRFYATDQNIDGSVALKLYFKNDPQTCEFQNQQTDPDFKEALDDCNTYKILNNRLYNQPADNNEVIDTTNLKPIYSDVAIPQCLTPKSDGKAKTHYINIFSLPEGENLKEKCMHGLQVNKNNSCVPFMRAIAKGLLHGMDIYNSKNRFFKHKNLLPQNIYLYMKNEDSRVFIDNMYYDNQKYDDIESKTFKNDFNMIADLLISLLTGHEEVKLKEPLLNTYDLYLQLKEFVEERHLSVDLNTHNLGVPQGFMRDTTKCVTLNELENKLRKSVFNFIYRLKCVGTKKEDQFQEVAQALNHEFITGGADNGSGNGGSGGNGGNGGQGDGNNGDGKGKMESWDASPADY